jgi:copper chaperone CopZ
MTIQSFTISAALSLSVMTTFIACESTSKRSDSTTNGTQAAASIESVYAEKATMRVDGLGCPMCAESIAILLGNIDAVEDSNVDLSTGTVHVDLDPTVAVTSAQLQSAIIDGGFTFRSISFEK